MQTLSCMHIKSYLAIAWRGFIWSCMLAGLCDCVFGRRQHPYVRHILHWFKCSQTVTPVLSSSGPYLSCKLKAHSSSPTWQDSSFTAWVGLFLLGNIALFFLSQCISHTIFSSFVYSIPVIVLNECLPVATFHLENGE